MWVATWLIGALLGLEGTRVDLPIAAITFDAPAGMVEVTPNAPALYECVLQRRLVERARLSLYVVPCPADASDETAWSRAMELVAETSARLDLVYELEDGMLRSDFENGRQRRTFRLVRVDERRVLLDLWGDSADVESLAAALDASAASVARSASPLTQASGPTIQDTQHGIRLRLPFPQDAAHEHALHDGLIAESRPPLHAGLDATFKVSPVRADLDLVLSDAATALRARTLALEPALEATEPIAVRAGAFDAFRIEYRGKDGAEAIDWLIDLPRHRLSITASARAASMVNLRDAFAASVASLTAVERRVDAKPASRRELGDVGIAFDVPDRMSREPRTQEGELIAFVEDFAKSPAARIVVRAVGVLDPGVDDAARLRATLLSRIARIDGLVLDAPRVTDHSLNGRQAASARFDVRSGTVERNETRVLIANGDAAIEFAFECDSAERSLFDACRESILLSFVWNSASAAPELASQVADAHCGLKLRPPAGFTRTLDEERRVRFVEGGALGGAFVEAAVVDLPAPNRFVRGVAERMRQAVDHRLIDEGHTLVRTELAPGTAPTKDGHDDVWITVAYAKDGMPWRELRRDVVLADRVVEIRLAAPAARFRELRPLAQASLRTLGW
ncbi:MAG: hypothetical protein IPH13_09975 [Planctomycetes bacterium]|nr:hypothetical protein [Planctomycetota bacterium]